VRNCGRFGNAGRPPARAGLLYRTAAGHKPLGGMYCAREACRCYAGGEPMANEDGDYI